MFYAASNGPTFRFGDVLEGFPTAAPSVSAPVPRRAIEKYGITVTSAPFNALLSPCCSIGDKCLTLAPLLQVPPKWRQNPYLAEDLTRINRIMPPEKALPPDVWDKMPNELKRKRLDSASGYTLVEFFVYAPNAALPLYVPSTKSDRKEAFYVIDFRRMYHVGCDNLASAKSAPIEAKLLELSIEARSELRDKLAYYFGRVPEEDGL